MDPVSQVRVLDLREDFLEEVVLLALDRRLAFLRVDLQALRRRAFSLRLVVEDFLLGLVVLAGSEIGGVQGGGGVTMKIELQEKNGTGEHARCLRSEVLEPLRTPLIFGCELQRAESNRGVKVDNAKLIHLVGMSF